MTGTIESSIEAEKDGSQVDNMSSYRTDDKYYENNRTQWRQWLACISATLSMVAVGTVYGWTTTSLSRLTSGDSDVPLQLTDDEGSWIVSLTVIGSMIGPFLGVCLADKFGRKRCLMLSSVFFITGWVIVLFAQSVTVLYISRVILGIGVGMAYTTNPMYVSEVADINIRGALGTLIAVNVFTGSLLACSIGPWVSFKTLTTILLAIPVLFILCFVWFPESPHFLAARGRRLEASKSLAFFKGIRDYNEAKRELNLILRGVSKDDLCKAHLSTNSNQNIETVKHTWLAKLRTMMLPNNARALCIILGLIAAQQLSGNFSTMQYLQILFNKADVGIDSNVATIVVLAVGLVSGTLATATVEGAGRRPLLIVSTFGSFLTLGILAIYLMLDERGVDVSVVNLLPVIDVILFQIVYQIGLGTITNALIGELFSTEVKGVAGAIITIFDGLLGFAVSKLYQVIGDKLGTYTVYYFFSVSCLLALLMVAAFVPETKDYPAGARFLKVTAVPTVNLPQSSIKTHKPLDNEVKEREIRLAKRVKRIKLNSRKAETKCNCLFVEADNTLISAQNDTPLEEVNVGEKSGAVVQETTLIDVKVEVESEDLSSTYFFNFLKTDKELSTATGIQNFKLFERIVAAVEIAAPRLSKHTGVITIRERVLMTFIKLKQNLSYSFLSILFPAVSNRYCAEVVCNMLDILSDVLRPYIYFPSGDEILKNMPLCFNKYTDTRIILDCTEIEIQKPKNSCCQITTDSNSKGRYTIKFMTGVTPSGIISFVSKPYGGKASDKAIFEQSLLLQQLEDGMSVMVNRGFLIDDLCSEYNVKLIRLPFLKDQVQFPADDAVENADIASARIHVESLNQRLKVFEILGSEMTSDLVPKSEKILTILCAVVNLSNPIFKDDLLKYVRD